MFKKMWTRNKTKNIIDKLNMQTKLCVCKQKVDLTQMQAFVSGEQLGDEGCWGSLLFVISEINKNTASLKGPPY